jgi:hypothetical protein
MNLTPIKANMTEVTMSGGLTVLFSYKTPVAVVWTNGMGSRMLIKTEKKWSATTTRHINQWAKSWTLSEPIKTKPQEYFDNLISEVK